MQNARSWKCLLTSFHGVLLLVALLFSSSAFATVTTTVSTDCLSCNGTATFSPGIAGNVQYEWFNQLGGLLFVENNAFGTSSLFNLCPGLYQVQWTNGTENGQEWFTVNTTVVSAGQPGFIELCSTTGAHNLNLDLEVGTALTGNWFDPFGNQISNTIIPSSAIPGFYSYQLQDGTCFVTSGVQVSIIENADPGLSTTYLICENYSPFELLDVMAGNPDTGGQWFDSNVNSFSGVYDPAVDVTGLFTYRIDTVAGCPPVFSTMMVIENPLPNPGENTTISVCPSGIDFNMTDALNGTPQSDGQWYDEDFNPVSPVFDVDVLPEGTYNYVVSGLTPCPVQESFLTIDFTNSISSGIDASIEVCENGPSINLIEALGGSPTLGGVWEGPNGVIANGVIEQGQAQSGDYTYTVDGFGCVPESSDVALTVELLPNAGSGAVLEVCENSSPLDLASLLSDADEGGSWYISGDEITGSLVVEGGQTYDLIYSVAGSVCPDAQANYTVQSDVLPIAGGDSSVEVCITEGMVNLTDYVDPAGVFTTEWIDPQGNTIDPNIDLAFAISGNYTYSIYSDNACPDDQAIVALSVGVPAFFNGSLEETGCAQGQTILLDDLLPQGIPSGGNWESNGDTAEPTFVVSTGMQQVFTYAFENELGCEPSVYSVEMDYSQQLSAGQGVPITLCSDGSPIPLSEQVVNASAGGSWLINGAITDDFFDPLLDQPGIYEYIVPANGFCLADTTEVLVEVEEGFAFDLGPDLAFCENEISAVIGNADCFDCEYTWNASPLLTELANPMTDVLFPDVSEEESFQLMVTVNNGACLVEDSMVVSVYPEPLITINLPDPICQGSEVLFEATGAEDFEWSGNVQGDGAFATGTFFETTEVTVAGVNQFGCSGMAAAPVDVFVLPDAIFDLEPVSACYPLELTLQMPYVSDENTSYFWEIDGQIYSGAVEDLMFDIPGSYDVTLVATSSNGCQNSFTLDGLFDVHDYPDARFDFNSDALSSLFSEAQFTNLSTDNELNYWDFGDGTTSNAEEPIHVYPNTEDAGYRVCLIVENEFGCQDEHCDEFFISGEFLVYVPNAFTPDNDGVNDVFYPVVKGIEVADYSFSIFNRWGEEIFHSSTPSEGWLGNVKGGGYYAQNEIYTWVLEVKDLYTAKVHTVKGHVSLLR